MLYYQTPLSAWIPEISPSPDVINFKNAVCRSRVFQCLQAIASLPVMCHEVDLVKLLVRFRLSRTSDPRDKLYSLFELAKTQFSQQYFNVDYRCSWPDVYHSAARGIIQDAGCLDLLMHAGEGGGAKLASWVPDWNNPNMNVFIGDDPGELRSDNHASFTGGLILERSRCQAGGAVPEQFALTFSEKALRLRATRIAGVKPWRPELPDRAADVETLVLVLLELARFLFYDLGIYESLPWPRDLMPKKGLILLNSVFRSINTLGADKRSRDRIVKVWELAWVLAAASSLISRALSPQPRLSNFARENSKSLTDFMVYLNAGILDGRRVFKMRRPQELPPRWEPPFRDQESAEISNRSPELWPFGICRLRVQADDELFVVPGCAVPLILRPLDGAGAYRLVGAAYVYELMDGQAVGKLPKTDVVIH